MAVKYFIEHLRQDLIGRRFHVRSDHQALVWLFRLRDPRGKIARWLEILSQYDFCIEYRPGKQQCHCDALSRCENPKDCECPEQDNSEPLMCRPCKKCLKRAQDMMHESLYKELLASQEETLVDLKEGESEKVKCLKETSEAEPSSKDPAESTKKEPDKVTTFWASTRPLQDLRRLQR